MPRDICNTGHLNTIVYVSRHIGIVYVCMYITILDSVCVYVYHHIGAFLREDNEDLTKKHFLRLSRDHESFD